MPLPKPRAGETLDEFLDRCPFDTRMLIEFEDQDQRFAVCRSLYEESQTKAFRLEAPKINRGEFISSWNKQIKKAEWNQFLKWFKYFKAENFKAADQFLKTGKISGFDDLFLNRDITKLYEDLFVETGTQIAVWHSKTFEKYVSKNQTLTNWREMFGSYGQRFAADKVSLVSGNRKKELQSVLKRLMSDPDFQNMNERQAQRVLRSRFTGYSKSQAERLVRTEVGAAANYASVQSANNLFGSDGYKKEWLAAIDGRERPSHNAANGQRVDSTEPFVVGGEYLKYPKDPSASAKNRINCRCTILTYPINSVERIEDRPTEGLVSDIGFGITGFDSVSIGTEIAEAIAEVVITGEVGGSIRQAKINEYIEKNKPDTWNTEIQDWAYSNTKAVGVLKDDILEFIDKDRLKSIKVDIEYDGKQRSGSYHNGLNKKIHFDKLESWQERYTTVYHEIGHHIHTWTRMFNAKDSMSINIMQPEWQAFYKKVRKDFGVGLRGKNKAAAESKFTHLFPDTRTPEGYLQYKRMWKGDNPEWKILFKDEIEELGERVVYEQLMDLADTIGALTKEKYGWGHGRSYYTRRGSYGQMAELFAHMSEWRFSDATIVKKVFPELYDDAMKLYDDLIEQIREYRGY